MITDDAEHIKRRIREHLRSIPKFRVNCSACGQYAATFTEPCEVYHYDCYKHLIWKITRQSASDLKSSS